MRCVVRPASGWGHRVETSGMERVATPDAPDGQPRSAHRSVYGDGLKPVGATGRLESASRAERRADERPVEPDRDEQHTRGQGGSHVGGARSPGTRLLDCHDRPSVRVRGVDPRRRSKRSSAMSSSAARCSLRADAAAGLARTTSRLPRGRRSSRVRIRCLSLRFTRFLVTASPTALLTTKPTDGGPSVSCTFRCATRVGRPARCPRRIASANSSPRRIRDADGSTETSSNYDCRPPAPGRRATTVSLVRRSARRGPCDGGRPGWHGRHACAYAAGSRGSLRGDGCSAGKYACSRVDSRLQIRPQEAAGRATFQGCGSPVRGHAKEPSRDQPTSTR